MPTLTTTRHPDYDDVTRCYGTCGRWIRQSGYTKPQRPGTVKHNQGGHCAVCAMKATRERLAEGRATRQRDLHNAFTTGDCIICETPMRPNSETITKHPGTRRHISNGVCGHCYHIHGRTVTDPEGIRPDFNENHARAALTLWLTERRHRMSTTHHLAA